MFWNSVFNLYIVIGFISSTWTSHILKHFLNALRDLKTHCDYVISERTWIREMGLPEKQCIIDSRETKTVQVLLFFFFFNGLAYSANDETCPWLP